jgi:hypothetical protein
MDFSEDLFRETLLIMRVRLGKDDKMF